MEEAGIYVTSAIYFQLLAHHDSYFASIHYPGVHDV